MATLVLLSIEDAAADRAAGAAHRLVQLRDRLERLRRGEPSTADDVQMAHQRALAQAIMLATARERLLLTHRSTSAVLRSRLDFRKPAVATGKVAEAGATVRPASHDPVGGADLRRTDGVAMSPAELEASRLRSAVVAMLSFGDGADPDELARRRTWSEKVVAECGSAHWRGWAPAICSAMVDATTGLKGAAISVGGDQGAELVATSNSWTSRLQELELVVGEGPTATAHKTLSTVMVDDFATERQRWQGYASAASGHDVRSVTALPLRLPDLGVAVLTLYGRGAAADEPPTSGTSMLSLVSPRPPCSSTGTMLGRKARQIPSGSASTSPPASPQRDSTYRLLDFEWGGGLTG